MTYEIITADGKVLVTGRSSPAITGQQAIACLSVEARASAVFSELFRGCFQRVQLEGYPLYLSGISIICARLESTRDRLESS